MILKSVKCLASHHSAQLLDILIHLVNNSQKFLYLLSDNNNKQTLKRKSSPDNNCKRPKILVSESDDVVFTEESNKINNNVVNNSDGDNSKLNLRSVSESFNGTEDNKLLVPTKVLEVNVIQESPQAERIKKIEKEIARCKSVIAKLDELEVDDDSVNSPYIRSEKYVHVLTILIITCSLYPTNGFIIYKCCISVGFHTYIHKIFFIQIHCSINIIFFHVLCAASHCFLFLYVKNY